MTAEIIDAANELVEQNLQIAIQAHRLNRNLVSRCAAVIATKSCQKLAGLLTQAARCALIARRMQRDGIGGCDEQQKGATIAGS